ncbi:MAG TPA: 50S ribosomal protein L13 [Porphyromonadaceae bacterium]|nr:50S ribosomal protein L13 [Porphyromonadaceae bacterium]
MVNEVSVPKDWVIVDAENQILGRMSTKIAKLLRGKYKPSFTPHLEWGDNVIVINADKVKMTGKKWTDRVHFRYSGYPGGQKEETPKTLMKVGSFRLVEHAVKGMLPKNRLGAALLRNLHVYAGAEHPHQAQNPKFIDINTLN